MTLNLFMRGFLDYYSVWFQSDNSVHSTCIPRCCLMSILTCLCFSRPSLRSQESQMAVNVDADMLPYSLSKCSKVGNSHRVFTFRQAVRFWHNTGLRMMCKTRLERRLQLTKQETSTISLRINKALSYQMNVHFTVIYIIWQVTVFSTEISTYKNKLTELKTQLFLIWWHPNDYLPFQLICWLFVYKISISHSPRCHLQIVLSDQLSKHQRYSTY